MKTIKNNGSGWSNIHKILLVMKGQYIDYSDSCSCSFSLWMRHTFISSLTVDSDCVTLWKTVSLFSWFLILSLAPVSLYLYPHRLRYLLPRVKDKGRAQYKERETAKKKKRDKKSRLNMYIPWVWLNLVSILWSLWEKRRGEREIQSLLVLKNGSKRSKRECSLPETLQ